MYIQYLERLTMIRSTRVHAGCFYYCDHYASCHPRATSMHTLAAPQQAQPYVCFLKPCVHVSSVFWQNPHSLALGEGIFSWLFWSPDSSCQCGSEEYVALGSLLHFFCTNVNSATFHGCSFFVINITNGQHQSSVLSQLLFRTSLGNSKQEK